MSEVNMILFQAIDLWLSTVAMQSGGILALPKRLLDPRRPLAPTIEEKEEGLIPYLPELPIPHQSILNYNQTVRVTWKLGGLCDSSFKRTIALPKISNSIF